ncbi:MAG: gamma-D-glutamyl-L-lysine dipeptidyl-peptidase [Actinomycetota bacterium]|nr:gamma-D-glutamyl-L-lysine dipeptidyl-peptidase [Actinomycetota bacterium]
MVLALLVLVACGGRDGPASIAHQPTTTGAAAAVVSPPAPPPAPPYDAWVDVSVTGLWAEPDQTRPLDAPSLGRPVDIGAWLAAMTVDDRLWLVDRLVTQALYGDRVTVVDTAGDWAKVVVPRQPSSLDPRGYPGWLPAAQLTTVPPAAAASSGDAVVAVAATGLLDLARADLPPLTVSFNTRLPVLATGPEGVTVATPGGGRGRLASTDVQIIDPGRPPPTGDDVVRSAQMFSGVDYLWAGTSGAGWDCSGLTSAAYAAHGVVIPRDADDQAEAGTPVDRSDLRPGDLLFFGADSVTHVGMYVGGGRMIQAPATGRRVETVPIDGPGLAARYQGARRYLQSG